MAAYLAGWNAHYIADTGDCTEIRRECVWSLTLDGRGSFFSFEPSELTKLVLALYIADWLARKGKQVSTFLYGLAPFVILVGIVLGLVLLENDLGSAIIIAGFATAMFFTAGGDIMHVFLSADCWGVV